MNIQQLLSPFEQLLLFLQAEMQTPEPWGTFHITALLITFSIIALLYIRREQRGERQLKTVLGVYSVVVLALEVFKQLIWAFNFDTATQFITWDYQWYAFPFQFCSTPMYVCLMCLPLRKCKLRDSLLSYVAFVTILGSIATMLMPESCFVEDVLVNIHTTYLHFGSFVVSVYLLMSGEIALEQKSLIRGITVFIGFVVVAIMLNEAIYLSGALEGETFNMFYISRYFVSTLPVFCDIQQVVSYATFVTLYIVVLSIGACIVYVIAHGIQWLLTELHIHRYMEKTLHMHR